MPNPPEVTNDVLDTLFRQAHDAGRAPVLCKPFRADILAAMCGEIQAWRALYPQYEYDDVRMQIVPKEPTR